MQQCVLNFLNKYNMHFSSIDLVKATEDFVSELRLGLTNEKSSLMMLPTYLHIKKDIPTNKDVIVIDAGGTNFRVALVHFDDNKKPVTTYFEKYPMPGSQGTISKDEFFKTVVDRLMPIIDKSETIGFCFSYPATIEPNGDGRAMQFSKEISITNMQGVLIGENINLELKKRGFNNAKKVIVLNDTVAAMLGGIAVSADKNYESYMGFILGTGTNTCYIEDNSNITKCDGLPSGEMGINLESGNFSKFPCGLIDDEFDSTTKNPNQFRFEKMVAGAYQSSLIFLTLKKACEEGLFTNHFKNNLFALESITMRDIDDFCYYPYGDNKLSNLSANEDDKLRMYEIIDCSFERSAKMVCVNISAILAKRNIGTNPLKPVCISADGTTFYKSPLFRCKLDYYIKNFTNDTLGLYCQFIKVDNAPVVGTSCAALFNI